jgi:glutamyl/glutaminyl-tRNA synthetase
LASTTDATGRLAPTPSGNLHLGNVLAFGAAWLSIRKVGGRLLYRNEDVDVGRARADVARRQREDLVWLGVNWDAEVPAQSTRDYGPWLQRLGDRVYRCPCTRRQIREAGGHDRQCRHAGHQEGGYRFALQDRIVSFTDRRFGRIEVNLASQDDPILRRRDGVWAYPLAVVADDIADGVTEVVRGADLLTYTAVQLALWEAYGEAGPTWMHSPLVLGANGRKLSKSQGSIEVRAMRASGATPADVWQQVLPWLGLSGASLEEAVDTFDPTAGPRGPIVLS